MAMRWFGRILLTTLAAFAAAAPAPAPALAAPWQPAPGAKQIPLWPDGVLAAPAKDAENARPAQDLVAGKPWIAVDDVSRPTMTVYSPKGPRTGAAVVVFPGGGYKILAVDLEGTEVCDWLNAKGITCVLLKYRVPDSGPHWDNGCKCHVIPAVPLALQDAQRALSLVRAHAAEWKIDPHKVGVLGFSAGGHLAAATSTHFDKRAYAPVDAADQQSCRPDFAVALYPGHLWVDEDKFELNPDVPVSKQTPPQFLLQAENDNVDDINHSLVYFIALKNAGVPVEYHVYATGGHAFGLRRTRLAITGWPALVEVWLASLGMLPQ